MTAINGFIGVGSSIADGVLVEFAAETGLVRVPVTWSVPADGTVELLGGVMLGPIDDAPPAQVGAAGLFLTDDAPTPVLTFALGAAVVPPDEIMIIPAGQVLAAATTPDPGVLTTNAVPVTIAGIPVQVP